MKPIPKLNLNMNPAVCDDGSLVFAKNMKVDKDGCLITDYGYENIAALVNTNIIGHIVGLDNKVYLFTEDNKFIYDGVQDRVDYGIADNESYHYTLNINNINYEGQFDDITKASYCEYFYIKYGNIDNSDDNYKLSHIGFNDDTLDNYFGFKLDFTSNLYKFVKYPDDLFISYYIAKLFEKINEIVMSRYDTLTQDIVYDEMILAGKRFEDSLFYDAFIIYNDILPHPDYIELHRVYKNADNDTVDITICKGDCRTMYYGRFDEIPNYKKCNLILEYDEIEKTVKRLNTAWSYSGGTIDGCVTTNITGEKILSICEYNTNVQVPIKHINLSYCDFTDDESFYTQTPKIPIANLNLVTYYPCAIPNGTYVFFIRYKIRKDVYTKWYLCSSPMFAGYSKKIDTIQGSLKYIDLHRDAAQSFVMNLSYVIEKNKYLYKGFQLGFVISHDDSTNARIWKEFDINTTTIYFDYNDVIETNIDDLQETTYSIYDVNNITPFKNKLYISNYKESNFNPDDINELAKHIDVDIEYKHPFESEDAVGRHIIEIDGVELYFDDTIRVEEQEITGAFTKTKDGRPLYWILDKSTVVSNVRNVVTNTEAASQTITIKGAYHSKYNPDIFYINYIEDKSKGTKPFSDIEKFTDYMSSPDDAKWTAACISETHHISHKFVDLWQFKYNSGHPFYNREMNIGYGCIKQMDAYYNNTAYSDIKDNIVEPYVLPLSKNTTLKKVVSQNNTYVDWFLTNKGFTSQDVTNIDNLVKRDIENASKTVFAYAYIPNGTQKIYLTYHNDNYDDPTYVIGGPKVVSGQDVLNNVHPEDVEDEIDNRVQQLLRGSHFVGFDDLGYFIFDNHIANEVILVYKTYIYTPNGSIQDNIDSLDGEWNVATECRTREVTVQANLRNTTGDYLPGDVDNKHISTLMPYQKYKAYAHFVDEYGVITNGVCLKEFQCLSDVIHSYSNLPDSLPDIDDAINLRYSINSNVSNSKYKGFFISLENVGDLVIELFREYSDAEVSTDEPNGDNFNVLHSIELDTLLYTITEGITLIDTSGYVITTSAVYHPSSDSNVNSFGNCGYVTYNPQGYPSNNSDRVFALIKTNTINTKLIKATNFIPLKITEDVFGNIEYRSIYDGFYGSYYCRVFKPTYNLSHLVYVAGKDIYSVNRTGQLPLLSDYTGIAYTGRTKRYTVRSNFNLNYLSLTEDIDNQIISTNSDRYVTKLINSAILSNIYALQSMYKDFYNVYFRKISEYNKIQFDNTLRVSTVLSDEKFNTSIFTFKSTDYYNIPTDRGIIVKVFSINDSIMVHTSSSLYRFDANATIKTNDVDVQLKESDPFDKGITQIFDSQYGFGGLSNKEAGCVTFDLYFFYDNISKHIYAYGGANEGVRIIDNTIAKFIEYYKPNFCRIIHDEKNDRVLFDFDIEPKLIEETDTTTEPQDAPDKDKDKSHEMSDYDNEAHGNLLQ